MTMRERALWRAIRRALLAVVAAIDQYLKETDDTRAA
jgi:hypothetical protein